MEVKSGTLRKLMQYMSILVACILPHITSTDHSSSSLPVYTEVSPLFQGTSLPHFLPSAVKIQVLSGQVSTLECRVTSLSSHHTVSWIRLHDISVLTVGGLVFSSDPRIDVVSYSRPGHSLGSWTLSIRDSRVEDSGTYQCQVNTEPTRRKTYTLEVEDNTETIYGQPDKDEGHEDDRKMNVLDILKNFGDNRNKTNNEVIDDNKTETILRPRMNDDRESELIVKVSLEEETGINIANIEEDDIQEKKREEWESIPSSRVEQNEQGSSSLLIPILSLFLLTIVVLGLGSVRGLYRRYGETERGSQKERSRKYSVSSHYSRDSALRRQRKADREDNIYESFYSHKLIEVAQDPVLPLIPVCKHQDVSVDSDYSLFYLSDGSYKQSGDCSTLTTLSPPHTDTPVSSVSVCSMSSDRRSLPGAGHQTSRHEEGDSSSASVYNAPHTSRQPPASVLVSGLRQERHTDRRIRFHAQDQFMD